MGRSLDDIPAMFGYTSGAIFIYQLRIKIVNQFFLFTGAISYSLYLTHVLIFSIVLYALQRFGLQVNLLAILVTLVLTYLVSYLYNKLIVRVI